MQRDRRAPDRLALVRPRPRRVRRRDAGAPPIDAARVRPIDAGIAAAVGTGFLQIGKGVASLNVSIDGGAVVDQTPVIRRALPAGRHRVVLTDPASGQVERDVTVTIVDGQTTRL